jgi:hypothetical protein
MTARPGSLKPATGTISEDRRLVWQRALTVLLDAGYMPELLNEGACFIKARQRQDLVPDATNRATAVVTIGIDGVLRVEVSGAGYYANAGDLAAELDRRQNALLHGILDPATVASKAHTP